MNKGELVDLVKQRMEGSDRPLSRVVVDAVISETVAVIMGVVAEGEKVTLVGFGTFERRDRKEREGRNPKTGDAIVIPAAKVPGFSPGKGFKEKVAA